MSFLAYKEREVEVTRLREQSLSSMFEDIDSTPQLPVPVEQPQVNPINNIRVVISSQPFVCFNGNEYQTYPNTSIYTPDQVIQTSSHRIVTSTTTTNNTTFNGNYYNGTYYICTASTTATGYPFYIGTSWRYDALTNINAPYIKNTKVQEGTIKKSIKNSIKRALKLFDNFGMEEDAKIFLSGDEVEISHPESMFKFVITKRDYSNIIMQTERPGKSVPFKLELFTKTNIHVANLCVYAEDTPILDQLFIIAMYVKSGNEEDLLRKANFFGINLDKEVREEIITQIDYLKPKLLM